MRKVKVLLIVLYGFLCTVLYGQDDLKGWHLLFPDSGKRVGAAIPTSCSDNFDHQETKVIVAVIDGGTDINHPDLKMNIWKNTKEVAGNGIDDDKNGYVDDINGWNFIGGADGNIAHENVELTRLYKLKKAELPEGVSRKEIKNAFKKKKKEVDRQAKGIIQLRDEMQKMKNNIHKDTIAAEDVEAYEIKGVRMSLIKKSLVRAMKKGYSFESFYNSLEEGVKQVESEKKYHYNTAYNPRFIVGDHPNDLSEKGYGNNDVVGPEALHGTHVAGIIGAVRNNDIGIDGVAGNVSIMVVRLVPDGDERDKDVANGIRYAVDKGARVINMSFGKDYSPDKKIVEEAIQYAASKDVVIVHASGNDGKNNDITNSFPNSIQSATGLRADNWIEVGASDPDGDACFFSNYGAASVDVFAPGKDIYSTLPADKYGFESGTSMAAPVVAGIACLIRSCYPKLTAVQVKDVIVKSAEGNPKDTVEPGTDKVVPFSSLCSSGGIVNAKKALYLASLLIQ